MWFRQKKALYDHDPATLSLELLDVLQSGLISKLTLVNRELLKRLGTLAEASADMPSAKKEHALFKDSAAELKGLNVLLDAVLAKKFKAESKSK